MYKSLETLTIYIVDREREREKEREYEDLCRQSSNGI